MSGDTTYSIERMESVGREDHRYAPGTTDLAIIEAWVPLGTVDCDWMGNAVEKFLDLQPAEPRAGRYRAIAHGNIYAVCEYQVRLSAKFEVTPLTATEATA